MKKGFVFVETLVVLVVLLVTVVGMFGMYTRINADIVSRKYYDNISDIYKTDILRSLVKVDTLNGSSPFILINASNCSTYMNSSCSNIMNSLKVENVYINLTNVDSLILSQNNGLKNSMREYLKTINKDGNIRYIIVNYKYNDKNYYASLRI